MYPSPLVVFIIGLAVGIAVGPRVHQALAGHQALKK